MLAKKKKRSNIKIESQGLMKDLSHQKAENFILAFYFPLGNSY